MAAVALGQSTSCDHPQTVTDTALSAVVSTAHAQGVPNQTRRERAFSEGESCERSDDCPLHARCVDRRCVLETRCLRGEVLIERGARALALARFDVAAAAYKLAETAYKEKSLAVPSAVYCGLSASLVAQVDRGATGDTLREDAARAATRCLATAPVGSPATEGAVAELASLVDRGLEVAALDRGDDARLMTGQDRTPSTAAMTVTVAFSGAADTGSRGAFKTLVEGEPLRREVTRCFVRWFEESHQDHDEGNIRVTYARPMDEYDTLTAARLTVTTPDLDPSLTAPDAAGHHWLACSATAVRQAVTGLRWPARAERWAESISVQVRTRP